MYTYFLTALYLTDLHFLPPSTFSFHPFSSLPSLLFNLISFYFYRLYYRVMSHSETIENLSRLFFCTQWKALLRGVSITCQFFYFCFPFVFLLAFPPPVLWFTEACTYFELWTWLNSLVELNGNNEIKRFDWSHFRRFLCRHFPSRFSLASIHTVSRSFSQYWWGSTSSQVI